MKNWTVWAAGKEMDSYLASFDEAKFIAESWENLGYDNVKIEEVNQ